MSEILLECVSEEETEEDQYRNALSAINHKAILEAVSRICQDGTMSRTYLDAVIDAILFIQTSSDREGVRSVILAGSLQGYFQRMSRANDARNGSEL